MPTSRESSPAGKRRSSSSTPSKRRGKAGGSNASPARYRSPSHIRNNTGANAASKRKAEQSQLSPAQLEAGVASRIKSKQYSDAAQWILASKYLSQKYQVSDLIRLVLSSKQFDLAGRLIRECSLQEDQLLITLFIKELVKSGQFHLAIRYAEELIPNFATTSFDNNVTTTTTWTPQTLIQAMIRDGKYKSALRYAKTYNLFEIFPPGPLVRQLVETQQWLEAFKQVRVFTLQNEIPLESLVCNMLEAKEWGNAIKCIAEGKLSQELFSPTILVQRMIDAGDFLAALKYVREFKLVPETLPTSVSEIPPLLCDMVNGMIRYKEFYKAIKYASKFGLIIDESRFGASRLIQMAIDAKQYHVATLYITKFKLMAEFQDQVRFMAEERPKKAAEFRAFLKKRTDQRASVESLRKLREICGPDYVFTDEMIDVEVVHDTIISKTEEIVKPPKKKVKEAAPTVSTAPASAAAPVVAPEPQPSGVFNFSNFASLVQPTSSGNSNASAVNTTSLLYPEKPLPSAPAPWLTANNSTVGSIGRPAVAPVVSPPPVPNVVGLFPTAAGGNHAPRPVRPMMIPCPPPPVGQGFDVASLAMQFHAPRPLPLHHHQPPLPPPRAQFNFHTMANASSQQQSTTSNTSSQFVPPVTARRNSVPPRE